ncbi:MAG: amidohydrolase, partial [Acidimicrobiia bacterium]|nr:amidohydrolase [Acidimicrobiia bacterium]
IVAYHVDPALEVGKIGLKPGAITSSSDRFSITLGGPGGHTARPHETVDLLYAAGKVLTDLPMALHRTIDARIPVALVFGRMSAGDADNVIPTSATLSGTCRLLDRATWQQMPDLIDQLVGEIVAPTGAKATVDYMRGIPPVVNDARVIGDLEVAIIGELGRVAVSDTDASMGAEDFADYLVHVPGALMRLGVAGDGPRVALHSARFDIDERALEVGIVAGSAGLIRLLESAGH